MSSAGARKGLQKPVQDRETESSSSKAAIGSWPAHLAVLRPRDARGNPEGNMAFPGDNALEQGTEKSQGSDSPALDRDV